MTMLMIALQEEFVMQKTAPGFPSRWFVPLALLFTLLFGHATIAGAADNDAQKRLVLAANEAFYVAFRSKDLDAMDAIWAKKTKVSVIHPGWNTLVGRDEVMASWHRIIKSGGAPEIHAIQPIVLLTGASAVVLCYEKADGSYLAATNVFVQEDGAWRMIHHHAGPAPTAGQLFRGKPI
ncbi:MAG: nuclear transport factor 2 family protein [Hyphomicrobiaceae bacterium]|nr:nuclear transport factor 2 family protein [Hyphomicrobiaceae bacterium]